MITVGAGAEAHFKRLIQQHDIEGLGIRLRVVHGGTPKADCQLEFCEPEDRQGDDTIVACEGFEIVIDAGSVPFLDAARIEYERSATGGQLTIKAPHIKGRIPEADASLSERVRYLLDAEINPSLAGHGGRVQLVTIEAGGIAVLQFGGGCHGCGMVDVTLKQGIETTLKQKLPEITAVRDVTDHTTGSTPYYKRAG
jgi:Fe/S biogenesis protein NfuA